MIGAVARKRRYGLAASVAARRERPVADPGPADEPVTVLRRCFADGRLWDRQGRPWRRVAEWLEPREAETLVAAGARWMVEWCGGRMEWPDEVNDGALVHDLLPAMMLRAKADRLSRRRTVPTVIVAERWRDDDGANLVLFYESGPYPRAAVWFV
jgi:hypothetical protein